MPDISRPNNDPTLLIALWKAKDAMNIGHRDVTLENIIIYREPDENDVNEPRRGYLIDWDLAWDLDKPLAEGGVPFSVRSSICVEIGSKSYSSQATWQFTSTQYRSGVVPSKHKLQFDMESLLYIVLYCAFLWLPHDQPQLVSDVFFMLFEEKSLRPTGEATAASQGRKGAFRDGGLISDFTWKCPPLQEWITSMRNLFSAGAWQLEKVAPCWYKLLEKPELQNYRHDRNRRLYSMNGREKDGHRRYLGLPQAASTVPTKRALEQSAMATTTTAERNVRQKLDRVTFSSVPSHASAIPPAGVPASPSRPRRWKGENGSLAMPLIPPDGAGNIHPKNGTARRRRDEKGKGRAT